MKKYKNKQKGFSLVEMLVYMGLFSILLIPLMQLFASIVAVRLESEATSSVAQDGRYILARLSSDVHKASTIVSPALGAPATNTLRISGSGFDYIYSLNGGNLTLNDGLTSQSLNSESTTIPQITFTTKGNGTGKKVVQVSVQVESKVIRQGNNKELKTFQTIVGTR